MITLKLFDIGSTGTGRGSAANTEDILRGEIEFQVEAVGATPAISWTVQGSADGTTWVDIAYVTQDATVAASKAAQTGIAVAKTILFIDGLDKRFFNFIAVNVSSNTNVTYSARLNIA